MALIHDPEDAGIPRPLAVLASWSWRLLLVGAAGWFAVMVLLHLAVLVLAILVALFLASVSEQPVDWLRRHGVPSLAGAWMVFLAMLAILTGMVYWVSVELASQFGQVGEQASRGIEQIKDWLRDGPLQLSQRQLERLSDQLRRGLQTGQGGLLSSVAGGVRTAGEVLAGIALMFFSFFFFLKDGQRIGGWVLERTPSRFREDVSVIGRETRQVMRRYLLGTTIIGIVDGALVGVALALIGVPLVIPLALLTFIGAYFPLVGAFVAGLLSALVALVADGITAALLVVGATILVQQLEGHVLEPVVLGRSVHLHPLVTAWSVAAGFLLAGIPGGFLAVPATATATRLAHFYRCRGEEAAHRT